MNNYNHTNNLKISKEDKLAELKEELLKYNDGRYFIHIKSVAEFINWTPEKTKEILIGYPYIEGRRHLYMISDVAYAITEELFREKAVCKNGPLRRASWWKKQ